ncbi:hypothetical protein [Phage vB_KsaM-C1]|nr:hypothetical protein [Phage vB_KsaM-C1]
MKSTFDEMVTAFIIGLFCGLGWGIALMLILTR